MTIRLFSDSFIFPSIGQWDINEKLFFHRQIIAWFLSISFKQSVRHYREAVFMTIRLFSDSFIFPSIGQWDINEKLFFHRQIIAWFLSISFKQSVRHYREAVFMTIRLFSDSFIFPSIGQWDINEKLFFHRQIIAWFLSISFKQSVRHYREAVFMTIRLFSDSFIFPSIGQWDINEKLFFHRQIIAWFLSISFKQSVRHYREAVFMTIRLFSDSFIFPSIGQWDINEKLFFHRQIIAWFLSISFKQSVRHYREAVFMTIRLFSDSFIFPSIGQWDINEKLFFHRQIIAWFLSISFKQSVRHYREAVFMTIR